MGKKTSRAASTKALKSILRPTIAKPNTPQPLKQQRKTGNSDFRSASLEQPSQKRFIELTQIIDLLSNKTGIDLQNYEASLPHTIDIQNNELFPFLHEHGVVDPQNGKVYLNQVNAITFVHLLSKIVPEINIEISVATNEEIKVLLNQLDWSSQIGQRFLKNDDCQLLIRRQDFKVYKYINSRQGQAQNTNSLYLDPLDAEMVQKHIDEINSQPTQQQSLKWLNLCWDAFRIVDNHSKAHIFQTITPSHLQSRQSLVQPVDMIKEKLQKRVYRSLDEFEAEMSLMFKDWLSKNQPSKKKNAGEGHRYFRTALAIQARFNKSIAKAREKLQEFELKAQLRK